MADLSITATQVLPDADGTREYGTAAEAITAGQYVYRDATTLTWKLFDANDSTRNTSTAPGVALNGASAGQQIGVQTSGTMTLGAGAAPAVGTIYVASATAGGIAPAADLTTGHVVVVIGVGFTGNKIKLHNWATGVTKA